MGLTIDVDGAGEDKPTTRFGELLAALAVVDTAELVLEEGPPPTPVGVEAITMDKVDNDDAVDGRCRFSGKGEGGRAVGACECSSEHDLESAQSESFVEKPPLVGLLLGVLVLDLDDEEEDLISS